MSAITSPLLASSSSSSSSSSLAHSRTSTGSVPELTTNSSDSTLDLSPPHVQPPSKLRAVTSLHGVQKEQHGFEANYQQAVKVAKQYGGKVSNWSNPLHLPRHRGIEDLLDTSITNVDLDLEDDDENDRA